MGFFFITKWFIFYYVIADKLLLEFYCHIIDLEGTYEKNIIGYDDWYPVGWMQSN